ncbi:opioid growth factor receptor-like protein 1 [Danio rerio]|uniref:Opioid growth factor receptor-like 1 n=1 Tax=Danio rerio TaxID=7955 RepID=E7EYE2_DANRE|nr:opioid growth factor receptor-like protein 1 [Danio rerio]|eukprot:NP_001314975.1 opioid growth factor receptor-like protein 1 [Danio rerio]
MGNLMGSWRYKEPSTVEECDSTWETDSESDEHQPGGEEEDSGISESMSPAEAARGGEQLEHGSPQFGDMMESSTRMKRSFYAAKDLYKYRHSYPNYKEPRQPNEYRNLRFYLNKIPLVPDGIYIEEILTKWRGDYDKLEHNHTYIQWLFPLREQGLNFYAQELTQDEIKEFQSTREAKRRFLLAYTIMLDFFGIKLLDKNGNVSRASNWQDRFQHLNESQHNYLRITRILKSLGELGFESFKLPLVRLLLEEALVEGTLPNMRHSALEYFVFTLRQHAQRRALLRFARRHYQPPENFIWGPPKKKRIPASISTGTRMVKNEVVERSVAKARSPREGRNNAEREMEDMEERKSGEWKLAKGAKMLQEGRGRVVIEEYIETIPL